jgi:GNAT superfamily N-acetyltransferase
MVPDDLPRVLAAWNRVLVHDQVGEQYFRAVMLDDPNYEPEGVVIAEENGGELLGFSACVLRREPAGKDGGGTEWEFSRAYLKGFFVVENEKGERAGKALLEAAEAYGRAAGKRHMMVTVYTGPYIFPGIDVRYQRIRDLLGRSGYRDIETIESVGVDLRQPDLAARLAGVRERTGPEVEVVTWEPSLLPAFREFVAEGKMRQWFPTGWEAHYQHADDLCLILRRRGKILGWARYHPRRPRAGFGPILVLERERGRGYGLHLLLECMLRSREAGAESMYAGWANTGFYVAAGWQIVERHALLTKDL